MGVSTDGQISFGYAFEDGYQFPWDSKEYGGDVDSWWRYVNGFKHSFELYTEAGEFIGGVRPPQEKISAYYAESREFSQKYPLPFKVINYCSGDYPMYILAVPSSVRTCGRGYPSEFDPKSLVVTEEEKEALRKVCIDHHLEPSGAMHWYLTSYWG